MNQQKLYDKLLYVCTQGLTAELQELIRDYRNEIDFNIYLLQNPGRSFPCPRTPLMIASNCGHEHVVRLLLSLPEVDINLQSRDGYTAFFHAVININRATIRELLDCPSLDVSIPETNLGHPVYACYQFRLYPFVSEILRRTTFIRCNQFPFKAVGSFNFDFEYHSITRVIFDQLRRIQLIVILLTTSMFQKQTTKSSFFRLIPYDLVYLLCKNHLLLPPDSVSKLS